MKILTWLKQCYLENYDKPSVWFVIVSGFELLPLLYWTATQTGCGAVLFAIIPMIYISLLTFAETVFLENCWDIKITPKIYKNYFYNFCLILALLLTLPSFLYAVCGMHYFALISINDSFLFGGLLLIPLILFDIYLWKRKQLHVNRLVKVILTVITVPLVLIGSIMNLVLWILCGGLDVLVDMYALLF